MRARAVDAEPPPRRDLRAARIRHGRVAVNKIDLVAWSEQAFDGVCADVLEWAAEMGWPTSGSSPISALVGDNVVERSARWTGTAATRCSSSSRRAARPRADGRGARFPVQFVLAPAGGQRRYAGHLAAGVCGRRRGRRVPRRAPVPASRPGDARRRRSTRRRRRCPCRSRRGRDRRQPRRPDRRRGGAAAVDARHRGHRLLDRPRRRAPGAPVCAQARHRTVRARLEIDERST